MWQRERSAFLVGISLCEFPLTRCFENRTDETRDSRTMFSQRQRKALLGRTATLRVAWIEAQAASIIRGSVLLRWMRP